MNGANNYKNLREYNRQNHDRFIYIINELFNNTPIKEFSFQKFYIGGSHLSLFSHVAFSLYYFDERHDLGETFYNTIKNLKENQHHFFIWPSPEVNDFVFNNIYRFNIYGGLSVYKRTKNEVDAFHFSGEVGIDMANFYINNRQFLLNVIDYFLNIAKEMIDVEDKSILGLHTGQYILDSFNEPCSLKKSLPFYANGRQVTIAPQELKCLNLLAKGFTTKWIAKELGLSPRTVETHLNSVKLKCNVWGKDAMVDLFHKVIENG
jgi:DNA-binding CsgD family transcriptional regulator